LKIKIYRSVHNFLRSISARGSIYRQRHKETHRFQTAPMVILHSFNKQLKRNCILLKYVSVNQVSWPQV